MHDTESATMETGLTIGDVAKMCDVPAYTIRYWEKEFNDYLAPVRTIGKQRRYTDDHIRQVLHLKKLLWEDRFSIRGAQRVIRNTSSTPIALVGNKASVSDTHDLALHLAKFIHDYMTNTNTIPTV
jgi:DNA-binding transcriptional MerR regulator